MRFPVVRAVLTVLGLAAVAMLAACSDSPTGPIGPLATTTEVVVYQPERPDGEAVSGTCFSESVVLPSRVDAWRCSSEASRLYDPCFELDSQSLVCRPDPAVDEAGQLLVLAEPLRSHAPPSDEPDAWRMQLEGGVMCTFQGGTSAAVDGVRLNYACDSGEWVLGQPVEGDPWIVEVIRGQTTRDGYEVTERRTVAIEVIWR